MQIQRLHVKRFRKFDDQAFEFGSGLTIVRGDNEAGKSTIVLALVAALFYDPKKNNKDIRSLQSWRSDMLPEILIDFEYDGFLYRLIKDFEKKEILLTQTDKNLKLDTFKPIDDLVKEALGIADIKLFEKSVCVRQNALADLASGRKDIEKSLQEVITSQAEDVSVVDVVKSIQKLIAHYKKGLDRPAIKPGPLKKLQSDIADKSTRLTELAGIINTSLQQKKIFSDSSEKLAVIDVELKEKQELLKKYRSVASLVEKKEILSAALGDVMKHDQGVEVLEVEKRKVLSEKEVYALFLEKSAREDFEKITDLQQRVDNFVEVEPEKFQFPIMHAVGAVAGFVIGLLGFFVHPVLYGVFLYTVFSVYKLYDAYQKKDDVKDVVIDDRDRMRAEIDELLQKYSVQNSDEFEKKLSRAQEILKQLEIVEGKMSVLDSQEKNQDEKNRLTKELAILEVRLEDIGSDSVSIEDLQKLETEVGMLERQQRELLETKMRSQAIADVSASDVEEARQLEEELAFLKEQYEAEEFRFEVFSEALEGIEFAKKNVGAKVSDVLTSDLREYVPQATYGKYADVRVDEDFNVYVVDVDAGEIMPDQGLSQGAQDLVYLASRFSLVNILSGNKKPPVILDDPMVTLDSGRKKKMMDVLKDFSENHQIFLMTYSDEYDEWGERVVEL